MGYLLGKNYDMKYKVLLIEDDVEIVKLSKPLIENENFVVTVAMSFAFGIESVKREVPDIILLDLMLPDADGVSFIKWLKSSDRYKDIPVIVLTAKSSEVDKVLLLELGADDYITKPFSVRELTARMKSVLRRYEKNKESKDVFEEGDLRVDFSGMVLYVGNEEIVLPKKEFEILEILIKNRNKVVKREDLIVSVWGYDSDITEESRTLDVHIGNIRKKLGRHGNRIKTVKGVGFKFT